VPAPEIVGSVDDPDPTTLNTTMEPTVTLDSVTVVALVDDVEISVFAPLISKPPPTQFPLHDELVYVPLGKPEGTV
jgi:hypothetical protein